MGKPIIDPLIGLPWPEEYDLHEVMERWNGREGTVINIKSVSEVERRLRSAGVPIRKRAKSTERKDIELDPFARFDIYGNEETYAPECKPSVSYHVLTEDLYEYEVKHHFYLPCDTPLKDMPVIDPLTKSAFTEKYDLAFIAKRWSLRPEAMEIDRTGVEERLRYAGVPIIEEKKQAKGRRVYEPDLLGRGPGINKVFPGKTYIYKFVLCHDLYAYEVKHGFYPSNDVSRETSIELPLIDPLSGQPFTEDYSLKFVAQRWGGRPGCVSISPKAVKERLQLAGVVVREETKPAKVAVNWVTGKERITPRRPDYFVQCKALFLYELKHGFYPVDGASHEARQESHVIEVAQGVPDESEDADLVGKFATYAVAIGLMGQCLAENRGGDKTGGRLLLGTHKKLNVSGLKTYLGAKCFTKSNGEEPKGFGEHKIHKSILAPAITLFQDGTIKEGVREKYNYSDAEVVIGAMVHSVARNIVHKQLSAVEKVLDCITNHMDKASGLLDDSYLGVLEELLNKSHKAFLAFDPEES